MTVAAFIPKHKLDLEACEHLMSAADDVIEPYLAELVSWLADSNWPVANPIIKRLSRFDERLAPFIIDVLRGSDPGWSYFVLTGIMLECRPKVRELCMDEVVRLIDSPTKAEVEEEVHLVAIDVMELYNSETIS